MPWPSPNYIYIRTVRPKLLFGFSHGGLYSMAIGVVEFSREGYKIR